VLDFLKVPTAPKKAIQILDINYAIICASQTPLGIKSLVENATKAIPIVNTTNILSSFNTTAAAISKGQ
jgi:hypothetical protein